MRRAASGLSPRWPLPASQCSCPRPVQALKRSVLCHRRPPSRHLPSQSTPQWPQQLLHPVQQPVRAVASPPASWAELASALPGQPGRAVVPRRRSAPPGDVVARGSKIFRQSSPEQRPSIPVVFERRSRPACVLLRTSGTAAASAKAGLRHPAKAQAPQTTVVFKQKTENDFNNHEHKWYQRLKSSGCTPDREQAQTMTTSKESWFFVCFSYWVEGAAV